MYQMETFYCCAIFDLENRLLNIESNKLTEEKVYLWRIDCEFYSGRQ